MKRGGQKDLIFKIKEEINDLKEAMMKDRVERGVDKKKKRRQAG